MPIPESEVQFSPETLRYALIELLQHGAFETRAFTGNYVRFPLQNHPFGLQPPTNHRKKLISFLGMDGGTSEGVASMCIRLGPALSPNQGSITCLRIIYGQMDEDNLDHHRVYFEVGMGGGETLMIGECTDCSGEGGRGMRDMEQVFAMLSYAYEVRIERVEIPYEQELEVDRKLGDSYYRFIQGERDYDFTVVR